MIVDCHTHLSCPDSAVGPQEHRTACKDIDACLVLAGCCDDRQQANDTLAQYIRQNPKAVGFGTLDPVNDGVSAKYLRAEIIDKGLKGIVLYCAESAFHPAHSRALLLYESACRLGLPVFFHNCPPFSPEAVMDFSQPWLLDEIARLFPELKIIVGRMGLPFLEQTLALAAKCPNVFADLTVVPQKIWQVYNTVLSAYEAGVMDKLLFGSGYPYAMPQACIETLLGFNKIFSDTHLPQVPREKLRSVVERDSLTLLGLSEK